MRQTMAILLKVRKEIKVQKAAMEKMNKTSRGFELASERLDYLLMDEEILKEGINKLLMGNWLQEGF